MRKRKAELQVELRKARKRAKRAGPLAGETLQTQRPYVASALAASPSAASSSTAPHVKEGCGDRMKLILMVYVLSDHRTEVAVDFSLGKGRGPRFDFSEPDDELLDLRQELAVSIEAAFDNISDDHLLDMFEDAAYYGSLNRIHAASRYVIEHNLNRWVLDQNCDYGAAPGRGAVLREALKFIPAAAPKWLRDRWKSVFSGNPLRTASHWLASFRRRWHAKIGTLESGEDIEIELLRQKACVM